MKPVVLLLLIGWLVAGCAPGINTGEPSAAAVVPVEAATDVAPPVVETATNPPSTATAATTTTATPAEVTTALPATATSVATVTPAATESPAVIYGRTADGAFFHGQPDAPVTLIDYSDFL